MKQTLQWVAFGLLLINLAWGQSLRLNNNIPVEDLDGNRYPHAWAGGNNMPQYSSVDLDLDGKLDLVVYSREGRTFTTYINTGEPGQINYRYDPRYEAHFDSCRTCVDFALLVDYNCDGRADVICGRTTGTNFQVYENVLYANDSVGFELRYDPIESYNSTSGNTGFMTQVRTDIPAIVDVDYDGDLDIISSQIGRTTWGWYRNYAMERYGRCDTLDMELEQDCWGHFRESDLSNDLLLADTFVCPIVRGDRTPADDDGSLRHVGDALLAFDSNADSLMELLIGDVSYSTAILAINQGTLDDALMTQEIVRYPDYDSSINVAILPAFYYVDVNNDEVRDLIVAPNNQGLHENVKGTVLYLNDGADNDVDFRFMGRSFIASQQLDLGRSSVPLLFDHNQDGLLDLLVAGENAVWTTNDAVGVEKVLATMRLYQNTGSADAPSFRLVDSNYLDLGNVIPPIGRPSPCLGDLDGDGDQDMLIGTSNGKILHYQNVTANGGAADFAPAPQSKLIDEDGNDIGDTFSASAPELYDFDGDGDLDLFIGTYLFGRVYYYENVGSASSPSFRFITDDFGQLALNVNPTNPIDVTSKVYARPRFIDHDQDGSPSLFIGTRWGYLNRYDNFSQGLSGSLTLDGLLLNKDFGQSTAPAAAVLDSTQQLSWVVGNAHGGLLLLNTQPVDTSISDPISGIDPQPEGAPVGFRLYPNPTTGELTLEFPDGKTPFDLILFNALGQELRRASGEGEVFRWSLNDLADGLYLLRIQHDGRQWIERVMLK
jgi:hypothetical protein